MTATKASRVCLEGPSARGKTIAAAALRDVLDILLEGSQRAVRLAVEGRSTARGTAPAWLEDAASFDLTAIDEGSTQLALAARPLRDVVPQHFAQLDVFGEADGESSGVEVFARGLGSAVSQELDSELFDSGLLKTYARFNRVFDRGFDTIEFTDGVCLRLDRVAAEPPVVLAELRDELQGLRLRDVQTRNEAFFHEEEEKLDRWAEDVKFGLERELRELDTQLKTARKASKAAVALAEKLEAQKAIKALEQKRSSKRRQLFEAQDDVDRKRAELIEEIENQLETKTSIAPVFTLRWTLAG